LLERCNVTHGKPQFSRQNKPRAAAHDDSTFMLGRKQHDFTKPAYVFGLRYKLLLKQLAEHFMKPRDCPLVDELKRQSRHVFVLGHVVEQLVVKHFPSATRGNLASDAAGVSACFSRNRKIGMDDMPRFQSLGLFGEASLGLQVERPIAHLPFGELGKSAVGMSR